MGLRLPEIPHPEMSRCSSLVRFPSPDGRVPKWLFERSRTVRFGKPEMRAKLVNRFLDRFRRWIEEFLVPAGSNRRLPPKRFVERLTLSKVGRDQSQPGTEPLREFLERSTVCNSDMFLRNFHAMIPVRFLDERLSSLMGLFEQFRSWNQERLKPETDLKALESSSWSGLSHTDDEEEADSANIDNSRAKTRNTQNRIFIFLPLSSSLCCWLIPRILFLVFLITDQIPYQGYNMHLFCSKTEKLFIFVGLRGKILEVLRNWPEKNIQVIVVTDGERILGLGDLGCQGMGIPVGKLSLYTALGGVRPSACLPVTIDVGTNNEKLLNDEFYIGLRQRRATGQEYAELLHEFMTAVKQNYGEKILVQFEDFANHNAFDLLAKYGTSHLVFNDDIQGTASVVLAGLVASLKLVGGTLSDHRFLFLGAGEAGTGIAELIALEIAKKTNTPLEEARKKIWLVDSKGLIVSSRLESLQHFKKPWAHEHEPIKGLVDAINAIKPTVLIGTSGVGRQFNKEVIEAMSTINEKPIILALSNPTSQSECTAEEAYTWSQGRAIFASGSPFPPVEYEGKVFVPGQANNAYIFPGFGLGLLMSGTIRVHDEMLLAASEALAAQVSQENFDKGLIYPPFANIRKISAHIAANVAAKAYELGLATRLPQPKDLVKYAESCMYSPSYRSYR